MSALAWWRLSRILDRHRGKAAALAGLAVAASVLAATSWAAGVPLESAGPPRLWQGWAVAAWLSAGLAALWAAAASSEPGREGWLDGSNSLGDGAGSTDDLSWEDWHRWGGLSDASVAGGLILAGWVAGAAAVGLCLPAGLFAALASGAGAGEVALALLAALAASAAGAAWGTAMLAGLAESLRGPVGAALLAALAAAGAAALGPQAPWATTPGLAGTARLAATLGAAALLGAGAAWAAVRRRLRAAAGEEARS